VSRPEAVRGFCGHDDSRARRPRVSGRTNGFEHRVRSSEVIVLQHGRPAVVLPGSRAAQFLVDVEHEDPQELIARLTGNYRRGSERTAKNHPATATRGPSARADMHRHKPQRAPFSLVVGLGASR